MMQFRALLSREFLTLWLTPTPYLAFLALLSSAGYFVSRYLASYSERVEQYRAGFLGGNDSPDLLQWVFEPYSETIAFFLLFVVPILSGRLLAEEKEKGTLSLILSAPVNPGAVILSKFIALVSTVFGFILCLFLPLVVLALDSGVSLAALGTSLLGLFFIAGLYIALGLAISQTVKSSLVATLLHMTLLVILYFLHAATSVIPLLHFSVAELFSPVLHSTYLFQGFVRASDVAFFIAGILGCLFYTYLHLLREERR